MVVSDDSCIVFHARARQQVHEKHGYVRNAGMRRIIRTLLPRGGALASDSATICLSRNGRGLNCARSERRPGSRVHR